MKSSKGLKTLVYIMYMLLSNTYIDKNYKILKNNVIQGVALLFDNFREGFSLIFECVFIIVNFVLIQKHLKSLMRYQQGDR